MRQISSNGETCALKGTEPVLRNVEFANRDWGYAEMKTAGIALSLLVLILLGSSSARAASLTGNSLNDLCKNYPDMAAAYIRGVLETIVVSQENGFVKPTICVRPNADGQQALDIVCQYIDRNAMLRDFPAVSMVSVSLSEAFPCQK